MTTTNQSDQPSAEKYAETVKLQAEHIRLLKEVVEASKQLGVVDIIFMSHLQRLEDFEEDNLA
jgi:hypothetical protein